MALDGVNARLQNIVGFVGPFEINKSWLNYQERLEFYFEANGIDSDVTKRAILLSQIGEATYELLRSLVAPVTPRDLSYAEIVERLNNHFNPAPNQIVERYNFNRRVQNEGESIADFVADLRKLSQHCNFLELENMLRDRIVCGVNDESLQRDCSLKKI